MRLRKKPWIKEALRDFDAFVYQTVDDGLRGTWSERFGRQRPLHVELGTGKGRFITETAFLHPDINFIGLEAKEEVLYSAAQKTAARELSHIRLMVMDIDQITQLFVPEEVDRFFINFCDPWPKHKHAKRRLTHRRFIEKYRQCIAPGGSIHFKTDNEKLFEFSLNEFSHCGLQLSHITFDLHNSKFVGNVMTEYETKFSSQGGRIYRCEAQFVKLGNA